MSLEISSQIAGILSCVFGLLSLVGLGMVYKNVNKQKNNSNSNVNVFGDAVFDKSFNSPNNIKTKK